MFERSEAMARWARVRELMARLDLDALLAIDGSREEFSLAYQRWLTGFIPIGGPAAILLHGSGVAELFSERIGKRVPEYFREHDFPIEIVDGFSPGFLSDRIARVGIKRLGVIEPESFPASLVAALASRTPSPELIDVSGELQRLRMRKSAAEIALIRRSCAIADKAWAKAAEIFKVGRRNFEIIADIEHMLRLEGAEGGFNLLASIPFTGRAMQSLVNPERIEGNARYGLEISPRVDGYYSQLTIPVTTYTNDVPCLEAYEHIVAAKAAALPLMRPGEDLSEIARFVGQFLEQRGHSMASLSLGHFCGMALEEPRHDPKVPCILDEGMTLIFHPVLGDLELRSLMRADTYLITQTGAERLNQYEGGVLCVA